MADSQFTSTALGAIRLAQQNAALNGGAAQVFQTLLNTADAQLAAAGVQAPKLTAQNYAQVLEGVEAAELERFCDAFQAHKQAEWAMGDMTP